MISSPALFVNFDTKHELNAEYEFKNINLLLAKNKTEIQRLAFDLVFKSI